MNDMGSKFPFNLNIECLKDLYENGENISDYVYRKTGDEELAVLVSYEIQAGRYIAAIEGEKSTENFQASMQQFVDLFSRLRPRSILEAGVGEGTTLVNILSLFPEAGGEFQWVGGFDISLARVMFAKSYGKQKRLKNSYSLFTGRIEQIPLEDDSIDLVFTSHAIEPNYGKEKEIIAELFRVTRNWLVLREPSFDLGGEPTRDHIRRCRYADNIIGTLREGGYDIVEHRLWGYDFNPNNKTAITVIHKSEKDRAFDFLQPRFVNPLTRSELIEREGFLYDSRCGLIFPILSDIPCLLAENALLCARLPK